MTIFFDFGQEAEVVEGDERGVEGSMAFNPLLRGGALLGAEGSGGR